MLLFLNIHTCDFLGHKDLKKHLPMKISRNFSECICSQLKYHQNRITSKIGVTLLFKMSLNAFIITLHKKVSIFGVILVRILPHSNWIQRDTERYSKSIIFLYFGWHPLWICYGASCAHFTVLSEIRGALLRKQMYKFSSTFIKKIYQKLG